MIMPQPMSTPTAAGISARSVGMTEPSLLDEQTVEQDRPLNGSGPRRMTRKVSPSRPAWSDPTG
jgi:hypothetical protein